MCHVHIHTRLHFVSNENQLFFCFSSIKKNAGPAPSPIGQLPPNEGMPGGPMAPNFFPVSSTQCLYDRRKWAMSINFIVRFFFFFLNGWNINNETKDRNE